MTDPSSASRGRRRRSGRHQQQPARRARSTPIPPEEARRNRDAAFGSPNPRRTWIGSSSGTASSAPSPQVATRSSRRSGKPPQHFHARAAAVPRVPARPDRTARSASSAASAPSSADEGAPVQRPRGRRAAFAADPVTEQDVWSATADDAAEQAPVDASLAPPSEAEPTGSGAEPTAALEPASAGTPARRSCRDGPTALSSGASAPSGASADDAAAEPGDRAARTQGRPAAAEPASGCAAASGVLDRAHLLRARLRAGDHPPFRRIGWALLAVVLLALVTAGAFLLFGEPLRTGMMLATKRSFLIGVMITVGVVGLVWALQIVLANLAHTTRERLAGTKRYVALALAALMVVGIALPFGRGVQSLWALQGLIGSESVFGGGQGEGGSFASGKDPWANIDRFEHHAAGPGRGLGPHRHPPPPPPTPSWWLRSTPRPVRLPCSPSRATSRTSSSPRTRWRPRSSPTASTTSAATRT